MWLKKRRRRQTKRIDEGHRTCRLCTKYLDWGTESHCKPHFRHSQLHSHPNMPNHPWTFTYLKHKEPYTDNQRGIFEEFYGNFFLNFIQHCFICRPPPRFHCVGGCWDRTRDYCDLDTGSQKLYHSAASHPRSARSHPKSAKTHPHSAKSHPLIIRGSF